MNSGRYILAVNGDVDSRPVSVQKGPGVRKDSWCKRQEGAPGTGIISLLRSNSNLIYSDLWRKVDVTDHSFLTPPLIVELSNLLQPPTLAAP